MVSYSLVGGGIGALGSVLIASGQFAGIDSGLRRGLAIFTGSLLIWIGLTQVAPGLLPRLRIAHPLTQEKLHQRLSTAMMNLSLHTHWWTPILLGTAWGLIPCGFLYAAQIKAAETGDLGQGALTMLAFGLGTLPSMVGIGVFTSLMSRDRRSQLFRLGGWVTLTIGVLTLMRTEAMTDYTGHAALFFLMLALVARPLSRLWSPPLRYRRVLGVTAFVLAVAHTLHMLEHTFSWNLDAVSFLPPILQRGFWAGVGALALLAPAALTSCDRLVTALGQRWRSIHLLSIPALVLGGFHAILLGSHYLGNLEWAGWNQVRTLLLAIGVLLVLLIRWRFVWSVVRLEKFYVSPR